jgi:head-tail adaptor
MAVIRGRIKTVSVADLSKTRSVHNYYTRLTLKIESVTPPKKREQLQLAVIFTFRGRSDLTAGMRIELEIDPLSWSDSPIGVQKYKILDEK